MDAVARAQRITAEQSRPLRQAVLRPHETLEEMASREDPAAAHYGVVLDGALVAVGSVLPEGGPRSWRVRGMATAPEQRSRGYGALVLRALVEHAGREGATRVWCNARVGARRFYEREGWTVESDVFEVPRIGPHHLMTRTLGPPMRSPHPTGLTDMTPMTFADTLPDIEER